MVDDALPDAELDLQEVLEDAVEGLGARGYDPDVVALTVRGRTSDGFTFTGVRALGPGAPDVARLLFWASGAVFGDERA